MQYCSFCADVMSLVDKGWQVHSMERASCSKSNEVFEQFLPVGPGEASTSNSLIPHESVPSLVPDAAVAGTHTDSSRKVIQIIVFGVALAAALMAMILWMLRNGQHRLMRNSIKGLFTTSLDGWHSKSGQNLESWGGQVGLTYMHSVSTESRSLPLCPQKHLPNWTRKCASRELSSTSVHALFACSQASSPDIAIWLEQDSRFP
jgi:hypothetical protein